MAQRILEVAEDRGVGIEVFCFGPAQRCLTNTCDSEAAATYNSMLDNLIAAGVVVGACINAARADGVEAELEKRGFTLRVARDEFVRFTLEQATVITF